MSTSSFLVSIPPGATPSSHSPQKRRHQVARACDWCRVHRIKCDNTYPCANCRRRGGECSDTRAAKSATLPQAYREIEKLKQRVRELEEELKNERGTETPSRNQLDTPSSAGNDENQNPCPEEVYEPPGDTANKVWEGIHISTARCPNKAWYGPASLFYLIGRINTFLTVALKQTHSPQHMMPNSASTLLDSPATDPGGNHTISRTDVAADNPVRAGESLSPTQEEYFLNLFWQSYHPVYPILDELEFKGHYQSLWVTSEKERRPSALVDIVIAVCMQYGMARLPSGWQQVQPRGGPRGAVNSTDSSIAGRWHYRRCLTLLSEEMESPTISTLQCHLLCAVYLCYGSFQNMADNACGLAVRTAYMLGLHLEPPQSMPRRERELRKRLWWAVYFLESKRSMKLGRPFTVDEAAASCNLPADDREVSMLSGSSFAPISENVTWLTWNLHNTTLMVAARRVYTAFYNRGPDPVIIRDMDSIAAVMEEWRKAVPNALQTSRQNGGVPFSTDLSPLEIEQFTPVWLQRQRLLLEIAYHNLCTNLYRPSICFALAGAPTALTAQAASTCARHAIAFTHITHQVLSTTPILEGWHEAFQMQWNVAMTLVGFVLAYPHGASTLAARAAIDLSVAIFENFGNSFEVAASASTIMSQLAAKVDTLMRQSLRREDAALDHQNNVEPPTEEAHRVVDSDDPNYPMGLQDDSIISSDIMEWPLWNLSDETTAEIGGVLGQTIDISAENFTDWDWAAMNNHFLDQWGMIQPES